MSRSDAVSVVLVADLAGCAPERSPGLLPSSPPPVLGRGLPCQSRGSSVKVVLDRKPPGYSEVMPRPRRDLTTPEKRHLHSLESRMGRLEAELQTTRREWADLVEEAGQAAVARELGVSSQAVADRLRRIRANREARSGRR